MSFTKNISKYLSNKYSQKFLNSGKKFIADATKIASKREIQELAEAKSDLIGNKIADEITNVSKQSSQKCFKDI